MSVLTEVDKCVSKLTEEALQNSETYREALKYIDCKINPYKISLFPEVGESIKKAAKAKITALALDSQI